MFEFLFKYPLAAFERGELVLQGPWPAWLLLVLIAAAAALLAILAFMRWSKLPPRLRSLRLAVLWLLQSLAAALILTLLWQPALIVTQLRPRQNVIAILVDDSRSMAERENGSTREEQAVRALQSGAIAGLQSTFQTRLYRFDTRLTRIADASQLTSASGSATHIGASLAELVTQMEGLPLAAVVLLSDGGDNSGGVDPGAIEALRNRRIPVYTVGLGLPEHGQDLEIEDVVVATQALAGSRLAATIKLKQRGLAGQRTTLTVRDGTQVVGSREVTLGADGQVQALTVLFNIGAAGARTLQFAVEPLPGETNVANNALLRLINVQQQPRRILYFEGEPRWEYKFIRRAADDDRMIQLVSMLRTTENKIYRQGVSDPQELAGGFPKRPEELFAFDALILGSVDAGYFNPEQQQLIRDFVDRRGGGLLLLGGRQSLSDGVWSGSQVADALPVILPAGHETFHRDHATVSLTDKGQDSVITRLVDDADKNVQAWKKLPYLMDYQDPGKPKPGALVLAEMVGNGKKMPLLITQNYGRGRTAVLATGGTWRWQMSLPLGDRSHDVFWQQLLRWLVSGSGGRVLASVPQATLLDEGSTEIAADVHDKDYHPAADARVTAHVIGPGGLAATLDLHSVPGSPGRFAAPWTAPSPGVYVADISAQRGAEEIGSDAVTFQRLDGLAESFHTEQNRALLERLAESTGGRYLRPGELQSLVADIPYSRAGISVQQVKELWNMPCAFLVLLLLRAGEWVLRRYWGIV
jgi:uncharacterized membrane protein